MTEELLVKTKEAKSSEEVLLVKAKDVVTPGEVLAKGMGYLPGAGTYREGDEINAAQLGLVDVKGKVIRLVPLAGVYLPKVGDRIIGRVSDILMSGWRVDIGSAYSSMLSMAEGTSDYVPKGADLTQYHDIEDHMMVSITNVTSQKLVDVSLKGPGLRKIQGGRIIKVNCKKVPRIIGKEGSMLNMVKQATGCNILVGQNGRVWLSGTPEKEVFAIETLREIEAKAHLSGLTDMIKKQLEEKVGDISKLPMPTLPHVQTMQRERRGPPRSGGFSRGPPRSGGFSRGPPRSGGFNRNTPRTGGFSRGPRNNEAKKTETGTDGGGSQ